jgi:hypothetical protein
MGDSVTPFLIYLGAVDVYFVQAHAMSPHQGAGAGQAIEVNTLKTSFLFALLILSCLLGCFHSGTSTS